MFGSELEAKTFLAIAVWGAVAQLETVEGRITVGAVGFVSCAFAVYLLGLWRRERRE